MKKFIFYVYLLESILICTAVLINRHTLNQLYAYAFMFAVCAVVIYFTKKD